MGNILQMEEAILGLPAQFNFKPVIDNKEKLKTDPELVVVVGLGGSHLCGGILGAINPTLPLLIHNDYGLPELPESLRKKTLFVLVSYSGNTEEVINAFESSRSKNEDIVVITTGGKLGKMAKEAEVPTVIMPDVGIQPRNAVGYSTISLATVLSDGSSVEEMRELTEKLDPEKEREQGEKVAEEVHDLVPLIYSSKTNQIIAYNWKIKFNETSKIPSFYNFFPELNHNEMEGFGVVPTTKELSSIFKVCFLSDIDDDPRVIKRMEVTENIYRERGIKTLRLELKGGNKAEKIFRSLLVADWATLKLSRSYYDTDADNVPMVEKFKKLIE
ncbi:MAG: bifunctional phosphoglucose/phosphomannose isomerase [Candidatus Paceibacterota bacterium]